MAIYTYIHILASNIADADAQALAWLLTVPGASRTLLDARVPYSTAALTGALGGQVPSGFASAETAAAMAQEAYRSAAEFAAFGADFVGVACTAALVTDRPKAGDHKVGSRLGIASELLRSCAVTPLSQ